MIVNRHFGSGLQPQINAALGTRLRGRRKYFYESFKDAGGLVPLLIGATGIPTMPTSPVAQGTTVHYFSPRGNYFQLFTTTAQAILPFGLAGTGLEISGDEVDNEALELLFGANADDSPLAFKNGTDSDYFIRAKFKVTDADGSDQFGLFLRKREAFAVPVSFLTTGDPVYTDIVLFGFAATVANPNVVRISYDQNNSGSATVASSAFTWADTKVHELMMKVRARKVEFFINGVQLGGTVSKDGDGAAITAQATTTAPSITLDNGDWMVGGVFLRHDAAVAEDTYLVEAEMGHLSEIGEDPDNV